MQLAIDQKSGEAVQLASLNVLASLESEKRGLGGIEGDRSVFLDGVLELLQTKCVPLREAALPAAAWAVSRTLDSKENGANVLLEKVAREISDASLEIQVCTTSVSCALLLFMNRDGQKKLILLVATPS